MDVEKLNLASLKSVRDCAQRLLEKEDKIDILINNAGELKNKGWLEYVFKNPDKGIWNLTWIANIFESFTGLLSATREVTEDGYELTFATNHLGHFLLTELLKPLILKSSASGFHPR